MLKSRANDPAVTNLSPAGGEDRPVRRRVRRKDARPSDLIEAAFTEFAAQGYAGCRLEDVAARAGVSKGTIYRYYKDKEALFTATVRSRLPPIAVMTELVAGFPGPTRMLVELLLTHAHQVMVDSELPVLLRIIIAEGHRFPALTELYYREGVSKGMALFEQIVARGVSRGEIRADHAPLLPMVMMSPVVMAVVWRLTFEAMESLDRRQTLDAHLDLLFGNPFTPST